MKKSLLWVVTLMLIVSVVATFSLVSCKVAPEAVEVEKPVAEEAPAVAEEVEEEAVPEEEVSGEVTFATYWGGGSEADAVEAIAAKFMEKYPNITIKIIPNDSETIVATVNMNLDSSEPWDTFMYWVGDLTTSLAKAGLIAHLDDVFNKLNYDEIAPAVKSHSRYELKLGNDSPWCLPINRGTFFVFYNVHVWEKAGLTDEDIPETWDEFLKVCEAIKASGVPPLVKNAGTTGYSSAAYFENFLLKTSGVEYRTGLETGKESWDDERFRIADNLWIDLKDYWHPDHVTLNYDEAYKVFTEGEAGMQVIGDWILGSYQTDMSKVPFEDFSSFPFPIIDPDIERIDLNWTGNAVLLSKAGAQKPAAKKWVEFWGTEEAQQIFASMVPNSMAISTIEYQSPMLRHHAEITEGVSSVLQINLPSEIFIPVLEVWNKRSLGVTTQDQAIKELEELRKSVIEE